MWNKNNHAAKGKGTFEFDLSAERMKDFSAVKAQKSEPSKLAKGLLGLCAFLASAHNSTDIKYASDPIYNPKYEDPLNPSNSFGPF